MVMKLNRAQEIYKQLKEKGVKAIDEFIINRKSEELFLDFKRAADDNGKKLDDRDRNNLAKTISGFGNSEGGVIVWGVDCGKDLDGADVAKCKIPLVNPERFVSWIEGAISGATTPAHSTVENHVIKQEEGKGFVVTYIPFSNQAPHQSIVDLKYYMRAGSSFVPVPHAVLSGMFGKRPQPLMYLMFSVGPIRRKIVENKVKVISGQIGFMVTNDGLGIARDIFLNVETYATPGKSCKLWFDCIDKENWTGSYAFGFKLGLISKEGFRIPPRNFTQPIILNFSLIPPFDKGFDIKASCGCEGSEIFHMDLKSQKDEVEKIYAQIIKLSYIDDSQSLVCKLFNMNQDDVSPDPGIDTDNLFKK